MLRGGFVGAQTLERPFLSCRPKGGTHSDGLEAQGFQR